MKSLTSTIGNTNQFSAIKTEPRDTVVENGSVAKLYQSSSKLSSSSATTSLAEVTKKLASGVAAANTEVAAKKLSTQSINDDSQPTRQRRTASPNVQLALSSALKARQDSLNQTGNNKVEPPNSETSSTQTIAQAQLNDFDNKTENDKHPVMRQRSSGVHGKDEAKIRINSVMRSEIEAINFSKNAKNIEGSFLRSDSPGQRLIKKMVGPHFEKSAELVMSSVLKQLESGINSLPKNASAEKIDDVLNNSFQTMMNDFSSIVFPKDFEEIVEKIASILDETVIKQAESASSPASAKNMLNLSAQLKQGITKALLLRVFTPYFANFCDSSERNPKFGSSAKKIDQWLNNNPQVNISGFKTSKFAVLLTSKINQASGLKHEALGAFFPKLLKNLKESDLSGFSALVKLDSSLKTKSSDQ